MCIRDSDGTAKLCRERRLGNDLHRFCMLYLFKINDLHEQICNVYAGIMGFCSISESECKLILFNVYADLV